jgi:GNAT superfamily N-acetyltransferase
VESDARRQLIVGQRVAVAARTVRIKPCKHPRVIEYSSDRPIAPAEVLRLLQQTAWGADRTEADIAKALEIAPLHVGAWFEGRLVGFARALTDGVYRGYVEDVVVDESARARGIGGRLLRELLEQLAGVELVALDCPDELVPFYASLGFVRSGNTRMEALRGRDR